VESGFRAVLHLVGLDVTVVAVRVEIVLKNAIEPQVRQSST
jgi:hypothetical protein